MPATLDSHPAWHHAHQQSPTYMLLTHSGCQNTWSPHKQTNLYACKRLWRWLLTDDLDAWIRPKTPPAKSFVGREEKFWSENLKGRDHSEDAGVNGRILEWILGKCVGEWRYSSTHSLTSALDGGEWSASHGQLYIYLGEMWWESVDWMQLAQNRDQWWAIVKTVMNSQVPLKARNFLTSWVTISCSRRTLLHGVSYSSRSVTNLLKP
jgi:hypothetical protein